MVVKRASEESQLTPSSDACRAAYKRGVRAANTSGVLVTSPFEPCTELDREWQRGYTDTLAKKIVKKP